MDLFSGVYNLTRFPPILFEDLNRTKAGKFRHTVGFDDRVSRGARWIPRRISLQKLPVSYSDNGALSPAHEDIFALRHGRTRHAVTWITLLSKRRVGLEFPVVLRSRLAQKTGTLH